MSDLKSPPNGYGSHLSYLIEYFCNEEGLDEYVSVEFEQAMANAQLERENVKERITRLSQQLEIATFVLDRIDKEYGLKLETIEKIVAEALAAIKKIGEER